MHGLRSRAELARPLSFLVAHALVASLAQAQTPARPQPELRVDVIDVRSDRRGTLQAGAGVSLPLGYYARLGVVAAGGVTQRDDTSLGSGRLDLVTRFLFDPFREARWGLSVGGGLTVTHVAQEEWRELVLVLIDLETPPVKRKIVPAIQLGLGGGTRVGVAVRPYRQGRR